MKNEATTDDTFYVGGIWVDNTRTAVVAVEPMTKNVVKGLSLVTRAGSVEFSVRLTLEQAEALHHALGDCIDWLTTIESRKQARDEQERRDNEEFGGDPTRGYVSSSADNLPAFITRAV